MGRAKLGLDLCKTLAASKGGRLLSNQYDGNGVSLLWECGKGHQWQASFHSIKDRGSWCPFCAGNRRLGLPLASAVAKSHGGECLSDHYTNSKTPLYWRCEHGHAWWSCLDRVKNQGTWCPTCAGKLPLTLSDAMSLAAEKGGKLLSKTYENSWSKLLWRCAHGHEWRASLKNVKNCGSWCPSCFYGSRRLGLSSALQLALTRGGMCLSDSYKNNFTHLEWSCACGHKWKAPLQSVKNRGTWCPLCASGRREREVRAVPGPQRSSVPLQAPGGFSGFVVVRSPPSAKTLTSHF